MVFIYVLLLSGGRYYVGKTENPNFRLDQHFDHKGSAWTKKYKPIKVVELIKDCDSYDEDKYTLKYMEKYGINHVRGGSFCEMVIDEDNKNTIKRMIVGSTDKCFRCHRKGHYANKCYATTYENGKYIEDSDSDSEDSEDIEEYIEIYVCKKCNKPFDDYKSSTIHEKYCKKETKKSYACYRCGRDSHFSDMCFATIHKKGYYL